MRIASNKVKDLVAFFHSELKELYSKNEIDELAFRVFERYSKFTRADMTSQLNENVNQSELINIYDAAKKLAAYEPLQYVLGECFFYKYSFEVNNSVLIPRPETEELVEWIITDHKNNPISVLDIGTGSGCIPISIQLAIPRAKVSACDISDLALTVAKKNARRNRAEVNFFEADALNMNLDLPKYDLIVSNPPYIKQSEAEQIHQNVKDHEPHLALFVKDNDAIIFYKRIIDLCAEHLKANGCLYFELNPITAEEIKEYAESKGIFSHIELKKDMSGHVRFLRAIKK